MTEFTIEGRVKVTATYANGATSSRHKSTDFYLTVSKNLDQKQYNDARGFPTKAGSHALTDAFVQGLIGNIHLAHEKGYKDGAEHLRYVISELERGFAQVTTLSEGIY